MNTEHLVFNILYFLLASGILSMVGKYLLSRLSASHQADFGQFVELAVAATEQVATNLELDTGPKKKAYCVGIIKGLYPGANDAELDVLIEAAVKEMKDWAPAPK